MVNRERIQTPLPTTRTSSTPHPDTQDTPSPPTGAPRPDIADFILLGTCALVAAALLIGLLLLIL